MGDAVAVDHTAAQSSARQPSHEPREVVDGVGGDVGAGASGAKLVQDPGDCRERSAVERFGTVRRHDGIEYERFETTGPLWLAAYCGVSPSAPPLLMRACAPVMNDLSSMSFTSGIGVSLNSAGYCCVAILPKTV